MNGIVGKKIFFLVALLSVFFVYHSPVDAHSSLKKTIPEGNAVLEQGPSTIEVWFQDPVVIHKDSIKIMNAKGNQISTAKSELDPNNAGHIITKLEKNLKPGKYTVNISVIAKDGYVIEEEFRFSVKEAEKAVAKELKLLKSSISDGEIHKGSPKQIELWFNQAAKVTAFGIFDDNQPVGTKQPKIDPNNPRHITIPLAEKLASGSYQITWYASPANKEKQTIPGQKVGVYYFAVDEFSPMTPVKANESVLDWSTFKFSFGLKQLAYWLTFVGMTVLFGISWFYSIALKSKVEQTSSNKMNLLFYSISLIGIILLIIQHKSDLPELPIKDFLLLKFTWIPITQFVLITLGIFLKKIRPYLFGLALVLWPFIIGHASYPRYGGYITMAVTALHVLAVGIWMGGLVAMIAKPKRHDSEEWLKDVGPSFSKWALFSVILIAFSGIWMAVEFLPSSSFKSLIGSEWGRSLLVKTALFLLLVIVGYIQRKTVKRVGSNLAHSFFKRVRIEVIYGVIIFFFAATIVAANPSAAEQGVYKEATKQHDLGLSVSVTPLEMGLNTISLDFKEASTIRNVKVELSMPPDWRIENNAFKVDEGTYKLTGNLLHAAGTINMDVKVYIKNGDMIEIPYRIVVPGEKRFNE